MRVLQKPSCKKAYKRLRANQKADLDKAVRAIMKDCRLCCQVKAGDLSDVLVYKFNMNKQVTLLAYTYEDQSITLTLLALGRHENFYRAFKKSSS